MDKTESTTIIDKLVDAFWLVFFFSTPVAIIIKQVA